MIVVQERIKSAARLAATVAACLLVAANCRFNYESLPAPEASGGATAGAPDAGAPNGGEVNGSGAAGGGVSAGGESGASADGTGTAGDASGGAGSCPDADADGVCDAIDTCPDDTDTDADGVCDAVDFALRGSLSGLAHPTLSSDGHLLFAFDGSWTTLHVLDLSDPTLPTPLASTQFQEPDRKPVALFGLDERRVLVLLYDAAQDQLRYLRLLELQNGALVVTKDIDTTSNRIYDARYDPATDRLYWSLFSAPSIYPYELAATPSNVTGLGSASLPFSGLGAYSFCLTGTLLFRSGVNLEIGDLSSQQVLASWDFPPNLAGQVGSGGSACFRQTVMYTTYFGSETHLIVRDVSRLPQTKELDDILLTTPGTDSHIALREPAPVAVVATRGVPLTVLDLSALPGGPIVHRTLPTDLLAKDLPTGFLACNRAACYVETPAGIAVLAP